MIYLEVLVNHNVFIFDVAMSNSVGVQVVHNVNYL